MSISGPGRTDGGAAVYGFAPAARPSATGANIPSSEPLPATAAHWYEARAAAISASAEAAIAAAPAQLHSLREALAGERAAAAGQILAQTAALKKAVGLTTHQRRAAIARLQITMVQQTRWGHLMDRVQLALDPGGCSPAGQGNGEEQDPARSLQVLERRLDFNFDQLEVAQAYADYAGLLAGREQLLETPGADNTARAIEGPVSEAAAHLDRLIASMEQRALARVRDAAQDRFVQLFEAANRTPAPGAWARADLTIEAQRCLSIMLMAEGVMEIYASGRSGCTDDPARIRPSAALGHALYGEEAVRGDLARDALLRQQHTSLQMGSLLAVRLTLHHAHTQPFTSREEAAADAVANIRRLLQPRFERAFGTFAELAVVLRADRDRRAADGAAQSSPCLPVLTRDALLAAGAHLNRLTTSVDAALPVIGREALAIRADLGTPFREARHGANRMKNALDKHSRSGGPDAMRPIGSPLAHLQDRLREYTVFQPVRDPDQLRDEAMRALLGANAENTLFVLRGPKGFPLAA
jgi:hypothetical protein